MLIENSAPLKWFLQTFHFDWYGLVGKKIKYLETLGLLAIIPMLFSNYIFSISAYLRLYLKTIFLPWKIIKMVIFLFKKKRKKFFSYSFN